MLDTRSDGEVDEPSTTIGTVRVLKMSGSKHATEQRRLGIDGMGLHVDAIGREAASTSG